jgi:SNF2 family DNA or RNA helicase
LKGLPNAACPEWFWSRFRSLATDAAGEGINLQRAHLMVNDDLPWNPNRIEQRFGRIHRIGQTEVCHRGNLVADETCEGDVYHTLLEKLDEARKALGGSGGGHRIEIEVTGTR